MRSCQWRRQEDQFSHNNSTVDSTYYYPTSEAGANAYEPANQCFMIMLTLSRDQPSENIRTLWTWRAVLAAIYEYFQLLEYRYQSTKCLTATPTLCFHFAGSEENLPDIAKSRDAGMDNKEFSSLLQILMKQNSFLF